MPKPQRPPAAPRLPFPPTKMLRVVTTADASAKPQPSSPPDSPTPPLQPWYLSARTAADLTQGLTHPDRHFELELAARAWRALVVVLEFLHQHPKRAEQRYLRKLVRRVVEIAKKARSGHS